MQTVKINEFKADVFKYIDFDNFKPFSLENVDGRRLKVVEDVPVGRWATAEDYEDFRIGREQIARGECVTWNPNVETLEAFIERTRDFCHSRAVAL